MDEATRIERLRPVEGRARVVIDTDTYNEIDDQFAVVHALLSPERMDVEALYAAPFHAQAVFGADMPNPRSASPGDGMEKSYEEILRLLNLMGRPDDGLVFRGSTEFLPDDSTPAANSDAVDHLIARASEGGEVLYVLAIGAITNVASAILRAPEIIDNVVVVWLGSHAPWWPNTREFNHAQDVPAARVVFNSGVPLVHIPCFGVADHLITGPAEMNEAVKGRSAIGDYLCELVATYEHREGSGWSKVIWDIATVAWMLDARWVPTQLTHAPLAQDDLTFSYTKSRHLIRQAFWIARDPVFRDLFTKLEALSQ